MLLNVASIVGGGLTDGVMSPWFPFSDLNLRIPFWIRPSEILITEFATRPKAIYDMKVSTSVSCEFSD